MPSLFASLRSKRPIKNTNTLISLNAFLDTNSISAAVASIPARIIRQGSARPTAKHQVFTFTLNALQNKVMHTTITSNSRPLLRAFYAFFIVIAAPTIGSAPALARNAYISNYNSNTVSVIKTATNTVTVTIPVGSYQQS